MTLILAIETSCDETAAAVIADGRHIVSSVVASQIDLHRRYGGVFPEVASRQHVLSITPVIEEAMAGAGAAWSELDAVAVSEGPGLAGSLLVGVNAAKGIAFSRGLPLVGVNHLEGHIYSNWLEPAIGAAVVPNFQFPISNFQFPILVLIVSGGHTELVLMEAHGRYRRLGGTLDDAAGEAFDKVARLLRLSYPGGPSVQRAARGGDSGRFPLPIALSNKPEHRYNFSFSGLKTAVLRLVEEVRAELGGSDQLSVISDQSSVISDQSSVISHQLSVISDQSSVISDQSSVISHQSLATGGQLVEGEGENIEDRQWVRDVAASFQAAVAEALVTKTMQAAADFGVRRICVCGGVAANAELRRQLAEREAEIGYSIPPIWLCTDNAAMIGAAAYYRFQAGLRSGWDLDVSPRLPLASWG